tara:strand:+ start:13662 stop:14759 length:1098 start_codon:yes stop_codon:yes gene_type:complete
MEILKKEELDINNHYCHKIIQDRNKFLVDFNLPNKTNNSIIPSSHIPVNFIPDISNKLFEFTEKKIFTKIQTKYNENINNLHINCIFFVENSYKHNKLYEIPKNMKYSYGFMFYLNESSYYNGGELCINDNLISLEDDEILLFTNKEKLYFREILNGEQLKIIGYITNELINDNYYFENNSYDNLHIYEFSNFLNSTEKCDYIYNEFNILENKETLIQKDKIKVLEENNNYEKYSIDSIVNLLTLNYVNSMLQNEKKNKIIETLNKYNINTYNVLTYKITLIKKSYPLTYFSPVIQNKEIYKNTDSKYTLLIVINNSKGKIIFHNKNKIIDLELNKAILVPNNFLYQFYIEIEKEPIYLLEISFF